MDSREMLEALERLLDNSRTAVLTTVDEDGRPRSRWMTPSLVRGRDGFLYAVTSPEFGKANQISGNPKVEWMVQSRSLDEIMNLQGYINVIDNPSVKAEVLEAIGRNLGTFWKLNPDETKMVVLETVIEKVTHFKPVSGQKNTITFGEAHG